MLRLFQAPQNTRRRCILLITQHLDGVSKRGMKRLTRNTTMIQFVWHIDYSSTRKALFFSDTTRQGYTFSSSRFIWASNWRSKRKDKMVRKLSSEDDHVTILNTIPTESWIHCENAILEISRRRLVFGFLPTTLHQIIAWLHHSTQA
jgi:hypothetical protein